MSDQADSMFERRKRLLGLVILDWSTVAVATVVALGSLVVYCLDTSVPPIIAAAESARSTVHETREALTRMGVSTSDIEEIEPMTHQLNPLAQLQEAGERARQLKRSEEQLERARSRQLQQLVQDERAFLSARSDELCDGARKLQLPEAEAKPDSHSPFWLAELQRLSSYRDRLFAELAACGQVNARTELGEAKLRFAYNTEQIESAEPDWESGLMADVDRNVIEGKNRKITVLGHSDSRGTCEDGQRDNRNHRLSYGRAWFVAQRITGHLSERNLVEGKDYMLTAVGSGAARPKPCEGNTCRSDEYDRENRRIEVAFQRLSLDDLKDMKSFPTRAQLGPPRPECGGVATAGALP